MVNQGQPPDPSGFTAEDEIDQVLGRANPNPTRAGCPSREVLNALARRERPIEDPAYEHLVKCSPCYREVRAIQQARVRESAEPARPRAWRPVAAAAVLFALVGGWLLFSGRQPSNIRDGGSPDAPPAGELRAELDLRPYAVARGDQASGDRPPPSLRRGSLRMTMLLPVGSEPGLYEIQVVDANLQSKAAAAGQAEIRNYVTTLDATIDLRSLPPGHYQLAIRRQGDEWQLFPVHVE